MKQAFPLERSPQKGSTRRLVAEMAAVVLVVVAAQCAIQVGEGGGGGE